MIRVGIDLGGTKIEGIAIDTGGREVARRRVASPRDDYEATVRTVAALVAAVEQDAGGGGSSTVGVGMPGIISPATGLTKNANSTWLIGRPFDRDLAAALARPLRVENDANCLAVSEAADGAGAGCGVVFAAVLGTGCGAGIVVHGRLLSGRNRIAGEWGHAPLPWPAPEERPGPLCYCGKFGCLESFVSGPALAADHRKATGDLAADAGMTAAEIAARAAAGSAEEAATLERWADRLARGLAMVVNVLDPDVIVLGGGLSNIAWLYETLPTRIGRYAFTDVLDTPIRPALHGDSSGVRGAAWLWRPEECAEATLNAGAAVR